MECWTTSDLSLLMTSSGRNQKGLDGILGEGVVLRQILQYKPVTVTENVTVYRKRTTRFIDWNLRKYPHQDAVRESRIADDCERTNIWQIPPAHHNQHPAVFPEALAERVIRYYSFIGDMVLDPFSGVETTGRVAGKLERRFCLIEKSRKYFPDFDG